MAKFRARFPNHHHPKSFTEIIQALDAGKLFWKFTNHPTLCPVVRRANEPRRAGMVAIAVQGGPGPGVAMWHTTSMTDARLMYIPVVEG